MGGSSVFLGLGKNASFPRGCEPQHAVKRQAAQQPTAAAAGLDAQCGNGLTRTYPKHRPVENISGERVDQRKGHAAVVPRVGVLERGRKAGRVAGGGVDPVQERQHRAVHGTRYRIALHTPAGPARPHPAPPAPRPHARRSISAGWEGGRGGIGPACGRPGRAMASIPVTTSVARFPERRRLPSRLAPARPARRSRPYRLCTTDGAGTGWETRAGFPPGVRPAPAPGPSTDHLLQALGFI